MNEEYICYVGGVMSIASGKDNYLFKLQLPSYLYCQSGFLCDGVPGAFL